MALLTAKRPPDIEHQSLTQTVDATFAFVDGTLLLSGDFVQDLFLALGVIAESLDAATDVRRSIADGIASVGDRPAVSTRDVFDRLLDIRNLAASASEPAGSASVAGDRSRRNAGQYHASLAGDSDGRM